MALDKDTEEMLAALNMHSVSELFSDIPEPIRSGISGLENGKSEQNVRNHIEKILEKNVSMNRMSSFLGGGAYDTYVPSAVKSIVGRSEFLTSYTPYQPETSQGLLQVLWEYQSMMCELTGMEVINNSMYDYATGLGEAALMAARIGKGKIFLIPETISWPRQSVLENYCRGPGIELVKYAYDRETGQADMVDFESKLTDDVFGALLETPNCLGVLETGADEMRQTLGDKILVAGVNALSLAVVRPPGDYGADIVVSEGQMLGNFPNYGGPMLGIMGCKKKHVRKMPGRVIGLTTDIEGRTAFCMTLQTREQHIRREKATSNICSNEALTTVATAAYLALSGGSGLRESAIYTMKKSRELANAISSVRACTAPVFSGPNFSEFVARFPIKSTELIEKMVKNGVIPGVEMAIEDMENSLLVAVSDRTTDDEIRKYAQALKEVLK
ncbi:MAG: aminomethyl-transferring glycine dehydrogenase subunit GcvPA [Candidatus Thermoplasmatota archaeon]|nr:aminomethyl-transferring glycine dehydrogenase subunit GcvPA [Euryarchaeota archaeon]MBU4033034.1 aminomethyl-transferring glycine dehydrogenase subunit GcvPA [Candidatus Thermoplasmatota archaeon]MBU4071218.1 aminomethyl-transferring glycine dehydrogenase subunit GcvPA [Candidatus Thermoplasmatota archaeon]MBU4145067.1 aminomethyl-transferring glycine dehydrogenase subunit GcvPA [Candidatus Thermoplasmatota archaeon]MBU4592785.1 aminomethyl-transferring glycine dehydrogenase subunit GcvPA [